LQVYKSNKQYSSPIFQKSFKVHQKHKCVAVLAAAVEDDDEVVKWRQTIDPQLLQTLVVEDGQPIQQCLKHLFVDDCTCRRLYDLVYGGIIMTHNGDTY
jgi:hypothetical protein